MIWQIVAGAFVVFVSRITFLWLKSVKHIVCSQLLLCCMEIILSISVLVSFSFLFFFFFFFFFFVWCVQVQGKDPSVDITQDVVEESEDERFDDMPDAAPPIELPPCELSKLEDISELFSSVLPSPIRREKLSVAIENDGYIKKLIDLFHMCEDLENMEGLHHLFDIFKSIFLLNKNALFEVMFSDEMIFDIVGVMEYDPSLPQPAKHRDYLRNKARFKEVVPMTNSELENKIHQTYRVQYIQEVILPTPSVFEENMLSSLSSFVFFNKVEIVSMIQVGK